MLIGSNHCRFIWSDPKIPSMYFVRLSGCNTQIFSTERTLLLMMLLMLMLTLLLLLLLLLLMMLMRLMNRVFTCFDGDTTVGSVATGGVNTGGSNGASIVHPPIKQTQFTYLR